MKKTVVLLVLLMLILVFTACESDNPNNTSDATTAAAEPLTTDQMQYDPMSFTGQISVIGTVGDYGRFNLSLSGDDNFELPIDYRGNQALPQMGSIIIATGQMNYRACCGPHLISTHFEVVNP